MSIIAEIWKGTGVSVFENFFEDCILVRMGYKTAVPIEKISSGTGAVPIATANTIRNRPKFWKHVN